MVVLAAAVTTKSGKALLSRQFVELTKVRIEGLLAAFPKLMGTEKQHTFVETETIITQLYFDHKAKNMFHLQEQNRTNSISFAQIRYVYQPLESLYILLVTNKSSNIMEDLETLHLLAKIVPEFCHALEEKEVLKHAFDLIFAFDEAIAMGYKERVNLQQIKHFLAMESNDEIRIKQEEKNKIAMAKKAADKRRKEIEKLKMEQSKMGISSSAMGSSSSYTPKSSYIQEPVIESKREAPKQESRPTGSKGMQLGKGKPKVNEYSKVLQEENVPDVQGSKSQPSTGNPSVESVPPHSKIHTSIVEKLELVAENDGGLKNMEVKGELSLTIFDNNFSKIKVHIDQGANENFQFKTHPNMNKTLFTNDNILALKDAGKAYPVVTPTSILKWRFATKEEKFMPLTINLWPSASGGETTVPVEFEKHCEFDISDVDIAIPIPGSPLIGEMVGSSEYDARRGILHWKIPLIDSSSPSGSMEFNVKGNVPASAFFPVRVTFKSNQTFCAIQVVAVTNEGSDQGLEFSNETTLSVDQYDIE